MDDACLEHPKDDYYALNTIKGGFEMNDKILYRSRTEELKKEFHISKDVFEEINKQTRKQLEETFEIAKYYVKASKRKTIMLQDMQKARRQYSARYIMDFLEAMENDLKKKRKEVEEIHELRKHSAESVKGKQTKLGKDA